MQLFKYTLYFVDIHIANTIRAGCEQGRELGSHTTLRDEAYEEIIGADRDLTPRYGWQ